MRFLVLVSFGLWLAVAGAASAQGKKAFIVGVQDYASLTDLTRTVEDADGYTSVFKNDLGFSVTTLASNPTRTTFNREFGKFLELIKPGDEIVFVFSGHGWSDGAENYLAFSDAPRDASEYEIKEATVGLLRGVLSQIRDRNPDMVFAIIDACRDNPFSTGTKDAFEKGLVRIAEQEGMLIAYAAGDRQKALDRLGASDRKPYSLFTRTLLPKLRDPNRPLMQSLDETRDEVEREAQAVNHKQRPAISSDVSYRYCFSGQCRAGAEPLLDQETLYWNQISAGTRSTEKCAGYLTYQAIWPAGKFSPEIKKMIAAFCPKDAFDQKTGTVFRDPFTNGRGFGPEMVVLAPGAYDQGSPSSEPGRSENEDDRAGKDGRRRRVEIDYKFAVGRTEVTVDQYRIFSKSTKHEEDNSCYADFNGDGSPDEPDENDKASWKNPRFPQRGDHPVVCVSWEDAQAFLVWLNKETGLTGTAERYRLLSESEWEYAARGGTKSAYWWGEDPHAGCSFMNGGDATLKTKYAHTSTVSCADGFVFTAPVGSFGSNGFNLKDMAGNVSEWVEDTNNDSYAGAPSDGAPYTADFSDQVFRGGSWNSPPEHLRSARRAGVVGLYEGSDLGFRIARTLAH